MYKNNYILEQIADIVELNVDEIKELVSENESMKMIYFSANNKYTYNRQ